MIFNNLRNLYTKMYTKRPISCRFRAFFYCLLSTSMYRLSRKIVGTGIYHSDPEQEKLFVGTPSEIGSEKFNLGIESFRQGIGRTVVVEVQNLIVMFVEGNSNDIERMQSSLFDPVVPPSH